MSTSKNRRLAAILFADIVGYTALMQKDELTANQNLEKFHQTLTKKVNHHKGQIINNYGDGCVCTFDSAVDAMHCAKTIQTTFQTEPKVPVRIGLHSGDVFFKDDNVFGDSVNIASRIESLGVAGAVLFSKQIKRHIANQTAFKIQSLGKFNFKNVEKTMEVFGLANEGLILPKRSEMKGKIKAAPKNKWLIPSIMGVLLLATVGYWKFTPNNSMELNEPELLTANTPLPPNVLNERVAIIPIQNNTTDKELDILGKMAADWINRGLMDIETAEVVSPYTVNQHLDAVGILPNNAQGKPSFSELTGARNFIQGRFYEEKGELIFLMELVDAISGKIKFKFPNIRGNTQEKEALITQIRESITGYWATRDLVDSKRIKAPKYEAYKSYLKRLKHDLSDENPLEAIHLDSTFYMARIHFLNVNRSGNLGPNKIHFDFFERHKKYLSNYETGWITFLEHLYQGNSLGAFNSLNEIRTKYPNDFYLNHECASMAIDLFRNPELSMSIYEELPLDNIAPEKLGQIYNWRLRHQVNNYLSTNQLAKSKQFIQKYPPNKNTDLTWYQSVVLLDAFKRNDNNKIIKAKKDFIAFMRNEVFLTSIVYLDSNIFLSDTQEKELKNDLLNLYLQRKTEPGVELLFSNFYAYLAKKPKEIRLEALNGLPKIIQIHQLLYAGLTYQETGLTQRMSYIIKELEKLTLIERLVIPRTGGGYAQYALGVLYTQMGQYQQAIIALRQAKKYGTLGNFQYDKRLTPLFDLPEFQELAKPIWPEVKG